MYLLMYAGAPTAAASTELALIFFKLPVRYRLYLGHDTVDMVQFVASCTIFLLRFFICWSFISNYNHVFLPLNDKNCHFV